MTQLSHTVLGHGPAFVWGHGLTSSRASEDRLPLLDWSAFTGAGRQVVRYDAAGHGETGGPADPPRTSGLSSRSTCWRCSTSSGSIASTSAARRWAARPPSTPPCARRSASTAWCSSIPPTAWETRAAQAEIYAAGADLAEREGKDAWLAAAAAAPRPAIFADLPPVPPAADISEELLPSVMRGAAASDLPSPDAIAALEHPTLLLAWAGDPGHPESTADRLHELLPNSELRVASAAQGPVRLVRPRSPTSSADLPGGASRG